MLRIACLSVAVLLLLGAAEPAPVQYRLGVETQASGAPLLNVEVRFRGDADGETRLALPDDFASGQDAWRFISDLTVKGASATEDGPAHRILRHRPNAGITVRYRVRSAYDQDPAGGEGNPYAGPLIRPDWFSVLGEFVFATPEGRQQAPARFRWGGVPRGWTVASDLEHGRMGRPLSVEDVAESVSMGGPRVRIDQRPIPGGVLRVAYREDAHLKPEPLVTDIARVIEAQRAYWNDTSEPYFVAVVALAPKERAASTGGTGRGDAFVLYASPRTEERLRRLIAHEHLHSWVPRKLGLLPSGEQERAIYWLSEGFTDFLTVRTLLRAGLHTPDEAVKELNQILQDYDASPVRTAPVSRIVADFWTDPKVRDLPYRRGALLALKWDEDLRRKSGGKLDLDDVLMTIRHRRIVAPAETDGVVTQLVNAAWGVAQIDLRNDIRHHAEGGALVELPETLFGGCVEVRTTTAPAYDTGFDHQGSFTARTVRGVRREGPAWLSGLRDGMKITALSVPPDTSQEVVATVADARGRARTIRFWPYGDEDRTTRALALRSGMTEAETAACGRAIAGL